MDDLQSKIRELEAKLANYEMKGNISQAVVASMATSVAEKRSSSVPVASKRSIRLRSLGTMTDMEMSAFADASTANPFY